MRFLFVSRRGASLSLATRIVHEGHKVHFFVNNLLYKVLGKGIIDKAKIGEFHNCDIVIFDEAGMGEFATKVAKTRPVVGSSIFADTFNNDIEYKQKVLAKCGLKLESLQSSLTNGNIDKSRSFVGLNTTAWFNGFGYAKPFHSYFKKTKFMERDMSVDTESMGCLLWYHKSNKITKAFLTPLLKELKKTGYVGAVNITSNITSEELTLTDVNLGFLYDSTYAALEGLRQNIGETFYRLAFDGIKRIKASTDWLTATRVSIPPYPFKMTEQLSKPIPIGGISEENLKHIWLRDMQYDNGEYRSACCDGYLMTITARGLTPQKAFRRTHRTIGNLKIDNIQFRQDIGNGLEDRYNKIKKWGWF